MSFSIHLILAAVC